MCGRKYNIGLIIVLVLIVSNQAFSQQFNYSDSIPDDIAQKVNLKPRFVSSVGSSFMYVPHLGNVTSFTVAHSLSFPITPKLSVNGGIIAGRLFSSLYNSNSEGSMYSAFNELSVYGSASYQVNPRLTLYGMGIRQLAGNSPFYSLPKSSYIVGSSYNFGSFSIGVSMQMSKWNNAFTPFPISGPRGFYPSF
jgi:hypothetical protein